LTTPAVAPKKTGGIFVCNIFEYSAMKARKEVFPLSGPIFSFFFIISTVTKLPYHFQYVKGNVYFS